MTREIYHVFNRSVGRQPIFLNSHDFQRAVQVADFYGYATPRLRFSHFNRLSMEERNKFLLELKMSSSKIVDIFAYCLIDNHYHFLLRQLKDLGIIKFLSNFQNSYAKYFNTTRKRNGALFQAVFKAVRIEGDEQLLHVSRYIHLNPFSSFSIKEVKDLVNYPWSSLGDYLGIRESGMVNTNFLLGYFPSMEKFKDFIYDQADYQRRLKELEYFVLE